MSDPYAPGAGARDERALAFIAYILYLLPTPGLTHLAGIVLAYVARDGAPPWLQTHYTFPIRTFWTALLGTLLGVVLCMTIIGIPLALLLWGLLYVWIVVRCIVGLVRLNRYAPMYDPYTWTF